MAAKPDPRHAGVAWRRGKPTRAPSRLRQTHAGFMLGSNCPERWEHSDEMKEIAAKNAERTLSAFTRGQWAEI